MLATERDDSAILPGMFRLAITAPGESEPIIHDVQGPFALIGRSEGCTCQLDHPDVSRRHLYLQAIYGRIFGIDLESRGGTRWGNEIRDVGWIDNTDVIHIGPYQLRVVDSFGLGSGSDRLGGDFSPLDKYSGQLGRLSDVEVEFLNEAPPNADGKISRLITLVGSSQRCEFRLAEAGSIAIHCSLLWRSDGLWVVDLSGRSATRVRGEVTRCAKLRDGQKFRVGKLQMRVRYSEGKTKPKSITSPFRPDPASTLASDEDLAATALELDVPNLKTSKPVWENPDSAPTEIEMNLAEPRNNRSVPDDEDSVLVLDRTELEFSMAPADPPAGSKRPPQERVPIQQRIKPPEKPDPEVKREEGLGAREAKLNDAQQRLAEEWERLHVERGALTDREDNLVQKEDALAQRERVIDEAQETVVRQQQEISVHQAKLIDIRQRLKEEWKKLEAARAKFAQAKEKLVQDRAEFARQQEAQKQAELDALSDDKTPMYEFDTLDPEEAVGVAGEIDLLEATRHHQVFRAEPLGPILVVTPLGDASKFHYSIVHTEANKVRRLLEGATFHNLIIDFESTTVISAVTIKVVVNLARITTDRGGRAVLCASSEQTRNTLHSQRLLDVWPLLDNREEALRELERPAGS